MSNADIVLCLGRLHFTELPSLSSLGGTAAFARPIPDLFSPLSLFKAQYSFDSLLFSSPEFYKVGIL
jgi:hypothetical protein